LKFDQNKIMKLTSEIFNSLEKLRELSNIEKEDFLKDEYKIASAKYFLLVSIGAVIDISSHLISKNRFRAPENYADTFKVLHEEKLLTEYLMIKLIEMAKFRNRLVHIYWELDDELIYQLIKEDIKDIEEFVDNIMGKINSSC